MVLRIVKTLVFCVERFCSFANCLSKCGSMLNISVVVLGLEFINS